MIGGNTSNLAIGVSLILRDQFTGRANAASRSLNNLQDKAQRAQAQALRNTNAIGASIGAAAIMGMREWVKVGATFDKQSTYMYSVAEGKHEKTLRQMKDKAMQVGVDTMFSTTEVSKAMTSMAQAGQTIGQIHSNINSVAVLAAATMSDIHSTASSMNDIMIGFNIPASERNAMRVSDIITKTINDSNIQLADFSESMKYVIPSATTLGISLEEVAAMIGVVGNAGIKGSMAGTNLENFLRYMSRAAGKEGGGKQVEALAMLGLTPKDLLNSKGQLLSVAELIPMIGAQLQQMEKYDIQGFNAMMDIFGVRGGRAGNLLVNNLASYATMLDKINNSQGTAQRTADDVMNSLWGTMEQLESTWENLKIVFTEAVQPVLQPLLKGLTMFVDVIRKLVQTPVGKWLTIVGAGFVVAKTAIMGYRAIVLTLRSLHAQLGMQFGTTSSQVVAGYGAMSAAANGYAAAAGRAAAAGTISRAGMAPGSIYRNQRGTWAQVLPTGGHRFLRSNSRAVMMHRASNFIGKASPWAAIGGAALQMGAGAVGEDTGAGRTMNVAGQAIGMAGTGAMIGSMVVPGIGTVVGGIVGAVGGLLWGLYDDAQREKAKIEEIASQNTNGGPLAEFDWDKWKVDAEKYLSMKPGDTVHRIGWGKDAMWESDKQGVSNWLSNGNRPHHTQPNRITINIDGKKAMDKLIDKQNYQDYIDLGI